VIDIPSNCPSCNSVLSRKKDQLFCTNVDCFAKNSKVVEKYTKKMKIKGLGPVAIKKLELNNINDIYELTEEILEDTLGKNGNKIFLEINNKTTKIQLADFLGASSIPLVGKTTADKITTTINDITKQSLLKDGLGEKASTNLLNWLDSTDIPSGITFVKEKETSVMTGLKICVSGRTPGFTKATLATYLAEYNISVVSSVTKDIDYLISEETKSAKAQKAIKLNINIITIDELKGII